VFKKRGVTPEPRQAAFIAEVEDYATGVFRGTFASTADLLGRLRDPLAAAAATIQPMRVRRMTSHVTAPWRMRDRFGQTTGGVTLETHVIPVGDVEPLRTTTFSELSRRLARVGRNHGLFDEGEALRFPTTEASVSAEVEATGRRYSAGVSISVHRAVSVWEALPSVMGGTPFDEAVLRDRIASCIRLAADLDLVLSEEAAVGIGIDRPSMLGRITGPNSMEYPFFGRGDEPIRMEPEDAYATSALARIADEVAADLVSRLGLRLGGIMGSR
jgi:hypothetical protein